MYRAAIRTSARAATRQNTLNTTPRRFAGRLSVPPADGPRSWKNSLARLGLAAGGIWYYSTSDVFADSGATCKENTGLAVTSEVCTGKH